MNHWLQERRNKKFAKTMINSYMSFRTGYGQLFVTADKNNLIRDAMTIYIKIDDKWTTFVPDKNNKALWLQVGDERRTFSAYKKETE